MGIWCWRNSDGGCLNQRFFGVSANGSVEVTSSPLVVEHMVIQTIKPYPEVKARIGNSAASMGMRAMLAKNDSRPAAAAERAAGADGLAIHYVALHGDLLALRGERRQLIAYYIGNNLSASEMTKVNPAAGLYAPLRVVVYANEKAARRWNMTGRPHVWSVQKR